MKWMKFSKIQILQHFQKRQKYILKLVDKMCECNTGSPSIVEDKEQTLFHVQTDGQTYTIGISTLDCIGGALITMLYHGCISICFYKHKEVWYFLMHK